MTASQKRHPLSGSGSTLALWLRQAAGSRRLMHCVACSEEVFGPVMAVAAFTTDEEAIALANDCPFGLGSSIFSCNTQRARAVGSRVEVRDVLS